MIENAKCRRMEKINGGANLPGVIVSFAADLSPQETANRMKSVKAAEGVTAVAADLGIVRAFQQQESGLGRLVVVTTTDQQRRPPAKLSDLLVQDVNVMTADLVEPDAIGVDYYANLPRTELHNRGLVGEIRDASWQREIPFFTIVHSDRPAGERLMDTSMTDRKLGPIHAAARMGSDAVVIDNFPGGTNRLVEATSHLNVPVYIQLGGRYEPREILEQAADVGRAGAGGVVIGQLELHEGEDRPTLSHMFEEIAGVVRGNKSLGDALVGITRTYK